MKEFTDEKGISFWEITKEGETIELRSNALNDPETFPW